MNNDQSQKDHLQEEVESQDKKSSFSKQKVIKLKKSDNEYDNANIVKKYKIAIDQ